MIESAQAFAHSTPRTRATVAPESAAERHRCAACESSSSDDQEFTRNLVAAIFRRAGAEVHTATSVREGARCLETNPDVVACDLAMPGEDGFAFLSTLRALPAPLNATPVIALTALGRPKTASTPSPRDSMRI